MSREREVVRKNQEKALEAARKELGIKAVNVKAAAPVLVMAPGLAAGAKEALLKFSQPIVSEVQYQSNPEQLLVTGNRLELSSTAYSEAVQYNHGNSTYEKKTTHALDSRHNPQDTLALKRFQKQKLNSGRPINKSWNRSGANSISKQITSPDAVMPMDEPGRVHLDDVVSAKPESIRIAADRAMKQNGACSVEEQPSQLAIDCTPDFTPENLPNFINNIGASLPANKAQIVVTFTNTGAAPAEQPAQPPAEAAAIEPPPAPAELEEQPQEPLPAGPPPDEAFAEKDATDEISKNQIESQSVVSLLACMGGVLAFLGLGYIGTKIFSSDQSDGNVIVEKQKVDQSRDSVVTTPLGGHGAARNGIGSTRVIDTNTPYGKAVADSIRHNDNAYGNTVASEESKARNGR